ncbi:hypothetical protein N9Y42_07775 [Mariniblastus sp.]|nr:hypothetical protein [Mariniblastus sp.]
MKRRHYLLATLIFTAVLVTFIFFQRNESTTLTDGEVEPLSPKLIASRSDMSDAVTSQYSIVFADVDWSSYAKMARKIVDEFAFNWQESENQPDISFFIIALTNAQSDAPDYVQRWLDSDPRLAELEVRGSGDVVWLKDGNVLQLMPAYDATPTKLTSETLSLFAE